MQPQPRSAKKAETNKDISYGHVINSMQKLQNLKNKQQIEKNNKIEDCNQELNKIGRAHV